MSDNDVVIRVEGLGKKYSLHHEQPERYTALRDVWVRQAKAAGRWLNPFTLAGQLRQARRHAGAECRVSEEEFWALKDVSFEIRRGERVGIIGRNGAGKSTLLKILSRITEPTTGRVEIRGRVASLLEVGTGFHPELTGRENIYLNGAILGMTRREIRTKFDEIVDFAEVEKFLDTPVKRYSSGMYVRLAFAVAAHLEPEILVVDEVLAVGDIKFQKKCIKQMGSLSDTGEKTILFVSHNMAVLRGLCSFGIVLDAGKINHLSRDMGKVADLYQRQMLWSKDTQVENIVRSGFRFHLPQLLNESLEPLQHGEGQVTPSFVQLRVDRLTSTDRPIVGISLYKDNLDIPILRSTSIDHEASEELLDGSRLSDILVLPLPLKELCLADGTYNICVEAAVQHEGWLIRPDELLLRQSFTYKDSRDGGSMAFKADDRAGILTPALRWMRSSLDA